jgi:hypothetical protein
VLCPSGLVVASCSLLSFARRCCFKVRFSPASTQVPHSNHYPFCSTILLIAVSNVPIQSIRSTDGPCEPEVLRPVSVLRIVHVFSFTFASEAGLCVPALPSVHPTSILSLTRPCPVRGTRQVHPAMPDVAPCRTKSFPFKSRPDWASPLLEYNDIPDKDAPCSCQTTPA